MTEIIPPWLGTMRDITGTKEVQGGADSPIILAWRNEIARRYPDMAAYCRTYTHDSIAWCGLTVAYCMAHNGIKPVNEFLWADNWRKFGTKLDKPRLGCVLTFKRTGGNHVALYEGEEGPYYLIRGGNQSDAVNVTRKAKSELTGMVWPAVAATSPQPQPQPPASGTFDEALRLLLVHEGGYTNDAADAGGPTNFGITIIDYRKYVKPNATAADVRAMKLADAKAIYRAKYWDAMRCDDLPAGVDYCVFDYGVNSGIGRAPKVLQRVLGVDDDGEIGPDTLAAVLAADAGEVIDAICDERLAFLKVARNSQTGALLWPTYKNGWSKRVAEVRADARRMAEAKPVATAPPDIPAPKPAPALPASCGLFAALARMFGRA